VRVKRYIQTEAENLMKISEKLREIEKDRLNGSVTIAYSILGAFMEGSISEEESGSIIAELENARTTFAGMGLVRNICSILQATLKKNEDPVEMSHGLFSEIETSSRKAVENSDMLFQEKVSFVTISNSSMIKDIMDRNSKNIRMVSLLESRPNLEAIELAKYLKSAGIPCTIYVDASTFYASQETDFCLVGSDSILGDYSLIHKTGTFPLAMSMNHFGKKFYSIGFELKFERSYTMSTYPRFMEHSSLEITSLGFQARNIYFDITPARYIFSYITENGFISPKK
jgi:translation initiation factor eIF-2B subunit delta